MHHVSGHPIFGCSLPTDVNVTRARECTGVYTQHSNAPWCWSRRTLETNQSLAISIGVVVSLKTRLIRVKYYLFKSPGSKPRCRTGPHSGSRTSRPASRCFKYFKVTYYILQSYYILYIAKLYYLGSWLISCLSRTCSNLVFDLKELLAMRSENTDRQD